MKKLYTCFALVAIVFIAASAQNPCLSDGITFTSQEQIDNFQTSFPGCTQIEGDVGIVGQDIVNLNGLNVLTSVGGTFTLINNGNLTTLVGLENLEFIGGHLEIEDNNALADLSGLEGLSSVSGNLYIRYNDVLINLSGLANLTSVGGNLFIDDNPLSDLAGFEKLGSVGGYIQIFRNSEMTSLNGIDNIDPESISGLSIINNTILSSCDVKSICDYLLEPGGEVEIYGNAFGCNNSSEITESCTYNINEAVDGLPSISIRPNPAYDGIITVTVDDQKSDLRLICYNVLGLEVEAREINGTETRINIEAWKSGLYTVVIYKNNQPLSRAKFVVR